VAGWRRSTVSSYSLYRASNKGLLCFADNLSSAIARAREILRTKVESAATPNKQEELTAELDSTVRAATSERMSHYEKLETFPFAETKVAGQTTDYVNKQIERYLKNM